MKTFHYTDNLKRHKRNVHGMDISVISGEDHEADGSMPLVKVDLDAPATNSTFICDICNKNLQSSYNLKRHKVAVHKDTRVSKYFLDSSFGYIISMRASQLRQAQLLRLIFECEGVVTSESSSQNRRNWLLIMLSTPAENHFFMLSYYFTNVFSVLWRSFT